MPREINARLSNLATRRKGLDRLNRLNEEMARDLTTRGLRPELWERRVGTQPHTRYTLGAMQAVDPDDTRMHIESATRVGNQLNSGLSMPVTFELQGSVALDVHIRRVSDVDLLALDGRMLTYDGSGPQGNGYLPTSLNSLGVLLELRTEAERLLPLKFPAANVDCSGGKCIAISGGSLARPVDVVPSHWHDTAVYQGSREQHDRGVRILNKKVPETILNMPFLHIKRVGDLDQSVHGGLSKLIRLTKNVKNDAEGSASADGLPSFDVAALMFHADRAALTIGYVYELYILREARRFLDWCWNNKAAAGALRTPDGSRAVLDSEKKWAALLTISCEMDQLALAVAREQNIALGPSPSWADVDRALGDVIVPKAA